MKRNPSKDLTGLVFERLTVLSKHSTGRSGTYYNCKCDCGNNTIVLSHLLTSGKSKSCGCYRKEKAVKLGKSRAAWINNKYPDGFSNMYHNYKSGAKRRNLLFDINKDDFFFLTQQRCYFCNRIPSSIMYNKRSSYTTFIYNGLDRFDNTKGYTKENCVPCCKWCNQAKSNMDLKEFNSWCIELQKHYISKL
jgi:hypothetical protein